MKQLGKNVRPIIAILAALSFTCQGCDPKAYSCTCETKHDGAKTNPKYEGVVCATDLNQAKQDCDAAAITLRNEAGSSADCKCDRNEEITCSAGDFAGCRLQKAAPPKKTGGKKPWYKF